MFEVFADQVRRKVTISDEELESYNNMKPSEYNIEALAASIVIV